MTRDRDLRARFARFAAGWLRLDPRNWREQVLMIMLSTTALLGPFVYVPSVLIAMRSGQTGVVVVDTIAIVAVYLLYALRGLPYHFRAASFMVVIYGLGAWLLIDVGPASQIYLLGFSVMTTLLLGMRVGLGTVLLNGATLLLLGGFGLASTELMFHNPQVGAFVWPVITINFLLVNTLLSVSVGTIIHALERSATQSAKAHRALERERAELLSVNAALAAEVSERSRAEAALRETSARLEGVLEHSPLLIAVLDFEGRYLLMSRSIAELFATDSAATEGCHLRDLLTTEETDLFLSRLAQVRETRAPLIVTDKVTVGEELRDFSTVLFPLFDDSSQVTSVGSIGLDVTDQVRTKAERERLEARLSQSQKMEAIGQLAGGVAHDFNNMLGVILGYAEMALTNPATPEEVRRDVGEIQAAAAHSADLTRQLLAFARRQTIAPEVLDLNEAVERMFKMLRRLIGADIELVWKPATELWPVHLDPTQVDQVLANLTVNARDAITGSGRITIETTCVTLDEDYCTTHPDCMPGDYVMLEVSDDGAGMDRATLARVFEPFFTTKDKGVGTGLGLATVYGIVRQNEGLVTVYSEPGFGTTFRVYLPRHSLASPVGRRIERTRPQLQTGHETVLVVEDEPALLSLTERLLAQLGYTVLSAPTVDLALRIGREHPGNIELLLTDVIMPGMNGPELSRRLSEVRPAMRSIFMSGYTADVMAHRGVLEEGIHFLPKPFTTERLANKVREVLATS